MFKDLIANVAILVAFVSVCYQVFRNHGLNSSLPTKHKLLSGGILGLLGISLMTYSLHFPNNIMIDFRNLAVILSALSGGWISAIITTIIISSFRILNGGIYLSTIAAVIALIAIMFVSCIIGQLKIKSSFKWFYSVGISELISCIAFIIIIKDIYLRAHIIVSYCISLTLISFVLYYYILYIETLTTSFKRYKSEAKKDFLTGLNNVRQFDNLYNEVVENAILRDEMVSLLFIDIDFFKKVNDTYGHKEGDLVLKSIGDILNRTCRSIDIVSRNGGEEFSVILIDCPPSRAIEIAERIRKAIETTPIELSNNEKINITISIGVSSYPDPVKDFELLIEKADEALYEAKRTGRNKVMIYR